MLNITVSPEHYEVLDVSEADFNDTFYSEYTSDTEMSRAIYRYNAASPEQRAVMDDVLISLCGWSFMSLAKMGKERSQTEAEKEEASI